MIKTLVLNNFGKYSNKNIEFSDTTIFFGDNETGKTTLFDAVYYGLCRPALNKTRRNMRRYGNDLDVQIYSENGILKRVFDDEEFLNLYAIGPGDIHINMSGKKNRNSEWLQKVESNLFSGDIDPSRIITDLINISSDSKVLKHNKEIENYTYLLRKSKSALNEKNSERESILMEKIKVDTHDSEINSLNSTLSGWQNKYNDIKREVDKENKILEREKYTGILQEIEDFKSLDKKINNLSRFAENKVREYDEIEDELENINSNKSKFNSQIEQYNGLLKNKKIQCQELGKSYGAYNTKSKVADSALNLIYGFEGDSGETITSRNNKSFYFGILATIFGAFLCVFGVIFGFMKGFESFIFILLLLVGIILFIVGILFIFFSKKSKSVPPRIDPSFINQIKENWKNELGPELDDINTKEDMIRKLNQIKVYPTSLRAQLNSINGEINNFEAKKRELDSQISRYDQEFININNRLEDWLKYYNVESRDQYLELVRQYQDANEKLKESKELLEEVMQKEGWTSLESSEFESKRKLQLLDNEFIPFRSERQHLDVEKLKNDLVEANSKINEIQGKKNEIEKKKEGLSGEIRGSSKDLDEEIVRLMKEIKGYENEINRIELDKKAARVALELFQDIKDDAHVMFEELGNDISEMYSMITPKPSEVNLTELNNNKIRVMDVNGEFRTIEDLSSGARDSFYFALRLSLARKNLCEEKILLFDDPFLTLDRYRERKAIELLKAYQERENWQIIFFTKEERVKDLVSEVFPNSLSYNVESLG